VCTYSGLKPLSCVYIEGRVGRETAEEECDSGCIGVIDCCGFCEEILECCEREEDWGGDCCCGECCWCINNDGDD